MGNETLYLEQKVAFDDKNICEIFQAAHYNPGYFNRLIMSYLIEKTSFVNF